MLFARPFAVLALSMTVAGAMPGLAAAERAAFAVAIPDYQALPPVPEADESIPLLERALGEDFTVTGRTRLGSRAWRQTFGEFMATRGDGERTLVLLSGRFATADDQTWFLYHNASDPDVFDMDGIGVPLDRLMALLSESGDDILLLLGVEPVPEGSAPLADMVRQGLGPLDVPEDVAVVAGYPRRLNDFIAETMGRRNVDLADVVDRTPGLSRFGSRETLSGFLDFRTGPDATEQRLWNAVAAANSVEGYRRYLSDYPGGYYAQVARAALERLQNDPERQARGIEEGLGLSLEGRRAIQRHLTMLGYNTRGVDGIFGSGTRRAITNWQQQNGYSQTSYLTADQIAVLGEQASRRAAELNRESERERARQALADQTYWEETGARGDASGLTAYLERFPDGQYAEQARRRLAAIELERRESRNATESETWQEVLRRNDIEIYEQYIAAYPDGRFVAEARQRIRRLEEQQAALNQARSQAEAAETALGLNDVTRRLVEARLAQLGLDPGEVDGRFDGDSRDALRRYQSQRGLAATGYMDEGTLIRLLADSFGELR